MLVSVIVPIYNAEKYLATCLESILNQTYKDIEVILVEDGSTDGSLQLCMDYAKKDSRIVIIQEGHHGSVAARKLGVEKSKGTYCMFVDSDDWIENDLLESMLSMTENGKIDIVNYNVKSIEGSKTTEWKYTIPEGIYQGGQLEQIYERMLFDFEKGCPGVIQSLCTKLVKRDILWLSMEAVDDRITLGDDAAVVYHAMLIAKKIVITNKYLYFYRIHSESMVRSKDINIFNHIYFFHQYMKSLFLKFENKYGLDKQLQAYLVHFIVKGISDNFSVKIRNSYRIPFYLSDTDKKVVLYGAGAVGKSYYKQLMSYEDVQIVAWVDKGLEKQSLYDCVIKSPDVIFDMDFDKILIAVKNPIVAKEIRNQLCEKVPEERILWGNPETSWWDREIEI